MLLLALTPAAFLHGMPPRTTGAARCMLHCSEAMPEGAMESVPPGQLADAWRREEKAKELVEVLKGCSVYVTGLGGRKSAVARVLARRLKYRCYDINSLMCSTYAALSTSGETVSLPQLVAKEPLPDVEQLAGAVLTQVQQFTRSVFVAWDGSVDASAFAVMQQGLVVNLDFEATVDEDVALPPEDADAVKEKWIEGHAKADVQVRVATGSAADDAAYQVVDELLAHIKANPAKSSEWKAEADAKLAETEESA